MNEPLDDERDTHAYVIARPTDIWAEPRCGHARSSGPRRPRKRYFFPAAHKQRPFLDCPALDLETTDALNSDILILPTGTARSAADAERGCVAV